MKTFSTLAAFLAALTLGAACAAPVSSPSPSSGGGSSAPTAKAPPAAAKLDPAQAERLKRIMVPLIQVADNKRPLNQVKVGIVQDDHVNAGSAGEGQYIAVSYTHL